MAWEEEGQTARRSCQRRGFREDEMMPTRGNVIDFIPMTFYSKDRDEKFVRTVDGYMHYVKIPDSIREERGIMWQWEKVKAMYVEEFINEWRKKLAFKGKTLTEQTGRTEIELATLKGWKRRSSLITGLKEVKIPW